MTSKVALLEKAGSTEILLILLRKKKVYITELKEQLGKGSMSTVNMRVLELKTQGLIEDKLENKLGTHRKYIWLTEKGRDVAKHVLEIEKLL